MKSVSTEGGSSYPVAAPRVLGLHSLGLLHRRERSRCRVAPPKAFALRSHVNAAVTRGKLLTGQRVCRIGGWLRRAHKEHRVDMLGPVWGQKDVRLKVGGVLLSFQGERSQWWSTCQAFGKVGISGGGVVGERDGWNGHYMLTPGWAVRIPGPNVSKRACPPCVCTFIPPSQHRPSTCSLRTAECEPLRRREAWQGRLQVPGPTAGPHCTFAE